MRDSLNSYIQAIFSQVPSTYELLNRILTLGIDTRWRKKAAKIASLNGGKAWLDVCSGTGQMAIYLSQLAPKETTIVALDFSLPMLRKVFQKKGVQRLSLCIGDAGNLPFPENSFDLVTISFATRNINTGRDNLSKCLQEFRRVLKPGGRFINLETSQPFSYFIRRAFHFYVRTFVKRLGTIISGSSEAYAYLSATIPRFFPANEFSQRMEEAGFSFVNYQGLTLGMVAVHIGYK